MRHAPQHRELALPKLRTVHERPRSAYVLVPLHVLYQLLRAQVPQLELLIHSVRTSQHHVFADVDAVSRDLRAQNAARHLGGPNVLR